MNNETLKVLVPIDFSPTSRRALAWAFDYATRAPCEVHLVHVIDDNIVEMLRGSASARVADDLAAVSKEAEAALETMTPDDRADLGTIYRHVVRGKPAAQILRVAEKVGAETIVMGTHGRSGLAHFVIGSVAERVVRNAHCPVVCVKPGHAS